MHRARVVAMGVVGIGMLVLAGRAFQTSPPVVSPTADSAAVPETGGLSEERDSTLETDAVAPDDSGPQAPVFPVAPELRDVEEWINTDPFRLADLRGRVLVVHYWTYG